MPRPSSASARIFVPEIAAPVKIAKIKAYGADVVVAGGDLFRRAGALRRLCRRERRPGDPPLRRAETVAGQGTVGLEWEEDLARLGAAPLDTVLVAVGGGGLIAGVAAWFDKRDERHRRRARGVARASRGARRRTAGRRRGQVGRRRFARRAQRRRAQSRDRSARRRPRRAGQRRGDPRGATRAVARLQRSSPSPAARRPMRRWRAAPIGRARRAGRRPALRRQRRPSALALPRRLGCCERRRLALWSARFANADPGVRALVGRSQVVRQRILIPPSPGSNPGAQPEPAKSLQNHENVPRWGADLQRCDTLAPHLGACHGRRRPSAAPQRRLLLAPQSSRRACGLRESHAFSDQPANLEPEPGAQPRRPARRVPRRPDHDARSGDKLRRKRAKEKAWDDKTARQAARLHGLFERYLAEQCGITGLRELRQPHLARFINVLQFEIYKHYGKSGADETRTIAELLKIAEGKSAELRGIEAPPLNRHLTFLNQLLDYARSQGARLDAHLSTTRLRARNTQDDRARNARPTLKADAATRVFAAPPFTGCRSWEEPLAAGDALYHRALYFVPLLLYYQGGRREEFCGLAVDDVVLDNGDIPYLHVAPNAIRRLKNPQSRRNAPLHPELLRLNFLAYVVAIKALGYQRLFPDLHSPSTGSPLGDRFYREFKPVLAGADTDEAGFVIHSLRRFGDALKQKRVTEEERGDLLGHVGKSEAAERYCDAYEIKTLLELVWRVPVVTAALSPAPIRLLPWVQANQIAPFSREKRGGPGLSAARDSPRGVDGACTNRKSSSGWMNVAVTAAQP